MLPFPDVPAVGAKYRWFAQHKDDLDVLFIGSSRFYHQIVPKEFDEQVARATGQKVRSFNAAYDAMWPPESYYFLRKLLALHPRHLKWVVIDAMDINPTIHDPREPTRREAYWHDWPHTLMALKSIPYSFNLYQPGEEPGQIRAHVESFAREFASMGRGAEALGDRLDPEHVKEKTPEWLETAGFGKEPGRKFEGEKLKEFLEAVPNLAKGIPLFPVNPPLAEAMRAMVAEVRKAGAEPIYVITPTLNPRENLESIPGGATLFPLNDPKKYPVLYDPAMHFDGWHLNEKGAHFFTQYLAEDFIAKLQGQPPAPR